MSTSKTYQQSLADASSETRPPMLERGSYIPWASRFRRYINRKRENRKWLNKALDEGPYQFQMFVPTGSTLPTLQTTEDLQGDELLHYDAKIELMNLILLSIPNEIYNSVDACTTAKEMWKRVELNTKFLNSLQPEWLKYVTQVRLAKRLTVDSFDDLFDYLQQFKNLVNASRAKKLEKSHDPLALDDVQTNSKDPLASAMLLLARAITQNFSNPTNNRLRTSSNTRNQAIIQGDRDEAGVLLTDEHNDFLFADASRMEEIEELGANICLMAIIQPANNTSDAGPSYDSAFISEVQSSSIKDNQEQMYPTHTKIINSTIGDDQIDSNIIFDEPNGNVNSGSVEKDTHVPDLYALEQLARNAYKEAEKQQLFAQKVQQQNTTLTSQLELYKERVWVLENINGDNNYLNEFLEADRKAKHFNQQAQSQFVRDRDIIRDLEKQRDKLDLAVNDYKRKNEELQKTHLILKRQMSENEDRYHDNILDLEAKLKKNVDLMLKLGNSLQGMFMLGPKPLSVYDPQLKHGLGQQKMKEKMNDPIAVANKQNCWTIDYKQINGLYKDFVPQKELSDEQKYFPSSFIPSDKTPNATSSIPASMPNLEAKLKKNVDLILKLGNSSQGMFMLGPKPLSVYDPQLKHGLGYPNPYTLKQAISQCPKLYLASSLSNSEIPLNVRDIEDTLNDASQSQQN
ncbi:hypothetical protein Tco_1546297 [Tanacetum coccineum]